MRKSLVLLALVVSALTASSLLASFALGDGASMSPASGQRTSADPFPRKVYTYPDATAPQERYIYAAPSKRYTYSAPSRTYTYSPTRTGQ